MTNKIFVLVLAFFLLGCAQTVYVPHGQAIRLRQDVKKAKVWVKTEKGETEAGVMAIPNGWYCLPETDN